jgi:hypothetical protein
MANSIETIEDAGLPAQDARREWAAPRVIEATQLNEAENGANALHTTDGGIGVCT